MLSLLRRFSNSPLGLGVLGLILLAFVVTLYHGQGPGSGLSGNAIAQVGDATITDSELTRRIQFAADSQRQQSPTLTLQQFVSQGGADAVLDQLINARAIEAFADSHDMVASKRLVDGQIASVPAFNGPTGQFDRDTFLAVLSQRKINEAELRADLGREALTRQLLVPLATGVRVPRGVAQPYASLLLETRQGRAQAIPLDRFARAAQVSPQEVTAFYRANVARYTVPEQRVIRYAQLDRSRFEGRVQPTEQEIAADYQANQAQYAGRETRSLTQAIIGTEAQAQQVLARIRAGTSFAEALRPLGLSPLTVSNVDRAAFAGQTSAAVADAAFQAPRGALATLARSPFGFHVVRVDAVNVQPARTLAQARPEILARLAKRKVDDALADTLARIEDEAGDLTFDELVQKYQLVPATLPPVTAAGAVIGQPAFRAPPAVASVLRDAFQAAPEDDPSVSQVGESAFVLWKLDRVIAAAPRPLEQVRDQVTADAQLNKGREAARSAGERIVAAINRGQSLQQATSGLGLPAAQPLGARRLDISRPNAQVPPQLVALFGMAQGRARLIPAGQAGWFVVVLDRIAGGDPAVATAFVPGVQNELRQTGQNEIVEQFMNAVRAQVGVKRNEGAFRALKQGLLGQGR